MHVIEKLKNLCIIWSILLVVIGISNGVSAIRNHYFSQRLLRCALSAHIAEVEWYTLLLFSSVVCVVIMSWILRLFVRDSSMRVEGAFRVFLFVLLVYVGLVYLNTSSWFPEFYSTRGKIYNSITILLVGLGVYLFPFQRISFSSIAHRIGLAFPVTMILLLYVIPTIYWNHFCDIKRCNIIVITVDTLRAQNLSMNGYSRETSPHLDEFAEQCLNFRNAYSQSSFTPPSHASLFTSRLVSNHGLLAWNALSDSAITMAEVMANEGYHTAAFVNMSLLSEQNLGQGFQTKVESFLNLHNCLTERMRYHMKKRAVAFFSGHEINTMFLNWARGNGNRPFFVWLHYWDVHRPYARDEKYETMFSDETDQNRQVGRDLKYYNLRKKNIEALKLSHEDLQFISDRYDAGIYTFDLMFAELLEGLRELGVYDNTLMVLTADHGENLMEREEMYFAHDPYLYNEVIHVPLLMKLPGYGKGETVEEPVMLIDVMPTICNLLSIPDGDRLQSDGEAFDPAHIDTSSSSGREIVSECFGWRHKRAIIDHGVKYIYDFKKNDYEVYDLNVSEFKEAQIPESELRANLDRVKNGYNNDLSVLFKNEPLNKDQAERLRTLGYIE